MPITLSNSKTTTAKVELKMAIIPDSDRLGYKARVVAPEPCQWAYPEDDQEDAIANALTKAGFDVQTPYELLVTHIANETK
jgi:hypothetical protein